MVFRMEEITPELVSEQPRLRLQWLIQEVSKIVGLPIERAEPTRRPITRATSQFSATVAPTVAEQSDTGSSDESDEDEIIFRFERKKHSSPFNCILHEIQISQIPFYKLG